jgi:Kef-type K+ transport system membrane component KefB
MRRPAPSLCAGMATCTVAGVVLAWPTAALASSGGGTLSVITAIAICFVAASAAGLLMRVLRQPLLLGYLLAGVLVGPVGLGLIQDQSNIVTVAEIGLILLLFMIGLEIDLKKMLAAGRWVVIPGLLQFPVCVAVGYLALVGLDRLGLDVGTGTYATLYVAIAISLSSTMIVVKLLFDRMELDTLPGRITVGILVFQDIWAIIVLAIQPNFNHPEVLGLARTFGAGALLVGASLLMSRYVLPAVFKAVAELPELLLVLSLGWCFLVALVASQPQVGLSMEMGALIAGVALATFPYNLDVVAKTTSIRDFFITLFFVALGMQIPVPTADMLVSAFLIVGVALAVRIPGVFGILYPARSGHRISLLATINLAQVSEFSLVILTMGVTLGHIDSHTLTALIWAFSILAVASTYLVTYSHGIQRLLSRLLTALHIPDLDRTVEVEQPGEARPVVLLGFFRIASALLATVQQRRPDLTTKLKVIDFNPAVQARLAALGVPHVYGDISHPGTLHHAGIHEAQVVACTIPDSFLKGTDNQRLLSMLRTLAPHAKIIVTAETQTQARELYAAGADYVLEAPLVAGEWMTSVLERALAGDLPRLRELAVSDLAKRNEVIS